jgi:glycosyl transferase, family 25
MRAYLINLDESRDRLAYMCASLARANVKFERVAAVAGANLAADERARYLDARPGCSLAPGEIGAFLSHQLAWQTILKRGDTWAAVLEDDAVVAPALGWYLDQFPEATPAALIKLETMKHVVDVGPPVASLAGVQLCELRSDHRGAAGYIIHRDTAATLLQGTQHEPDAIDVIFCRAYRRRPGMRVLQTVPALVIQSIFVDGRFPSVHGHRGPPIRRRGGKVREAGRAFERRIRIVTKYVERMARRTRRMEVPFVDHDGALISATHGLPKEGAQNSSS